MSLIFATMSIGGVIMLFFLRNPRCITGVVFMLLPISPVAVIAMGSPTGFVLFWLLSWIIAAMLYLPDVMYLRKSIDQTWSKWDVCKDSQAQQTRLAKAIDGGVAMKALNKRLLYAQFVGSRGAKYITTLQSCTCPDYSERHLPCKHMYKLAIVLEIPSEMLLAPRADDPPMDAESARVNRRALSRLMIR